MRRKQRTTEREFRRGQMDPLYRQLPQTWPAGDPDVGGDES
jgi:hypothetical protein